MSSFPQHRPQSAGDQDPAPTAFLGFRVAAAQDAEGQDDLRRCEDAQPVFEQLPGNRVVLAVADGLGGYAHGYGGKSGGQIASRVAMKALTEFFAGSKPGDPPDPESLTNFIFKKLRHLAETNLPPSRIRGALGRHKLATTLAAAVAQITADPGQCTVRCYWIGDSRIYFFTNEALHQLSQDDNLTGSDAFDSIFDAPPMSQFLAASMEREWQINLHELVLEQPGVLFVCTDGCFSDWPNPWRFEAVLQQALLNSDSWIDWVEAIRVQLNKVRSDDASLAAFPVNRCEFDDFKRQRRKSATDGLCARCVRTEEDGARPVEEIWSSMYKPSYSKFSRLSGPPNRGTAESLASGDTDRQKGLAGQSCPAHQTKTKHGKSRFASNSGRLGLAWLLGFLCGIPLGEKITAWFDLFWRWMKSLWQST